MSKKMKTRKGKDNINYPYTSPDLVVDSTGESQTTKNNNMKTDIDTIKTDLGTAQLTTTAKDIKGAINEVNKKIGTGTAPTVNSIEPELMDMPRIYFSEGTLPTSKTATMMKFDYYSKTTEYHGWVEIKCQGNSSMSYPKKNFTIKLYKDKAKTGKLKIDFKGWGKQSKFVLKANWIDISHARNVVSARLWGDIIKTRSDYTTAVPELLRTSPNQGAIDGFPVLVYSNGVYQGRYTLNIPKDKWMSNMDDALDTHCILCGENYQSGCFRALPQINGSDWTDELHDVVPATIKTSWTNAIKFVMNSSDTEFKANLSNYFDINSLIDYLLYSIICTNLDGFGKNQLFFTYDGIHWIASVYDLDSTWGLWWNGTKFVATNYAREDFQDLKDEGNGVTKQGNLLYLRLQQLFIPQLKARYTELRKDVLSVSHIIQKFEEFNDVCPKDIVQEDYASTTGEGKFTGIPSKTNNNIQQLRSYINARLTYVDGYINALTEPKPCTAISLNKTTLTLTGNSSTEIPSDENIDVTKNAQNGFICRSTNHINGNGKKYGEIKDSSQDMTTDFIPCNSTNTFELTVPASAYGSGVVAYDSNKNAIKVYTTELKWVAFGADDLELKATTITISSIPENTAYIRICFNLTDLSNVVLTKKYNQTSTGATSQKLIATLTPTDTTDKVVWSVSPSGICSVNNGVVTPIKNGQCIITATCGTKTATCNVTVNLPSVACTSIALNKTELQLGTIEGAQPDTETNLLEGLTWKDGQINDTTGNIITGTDKYIADIKIPATGLYTFSANVNYTYFKMFVYNSDNQLIQYNVSSKGGPTSIYVYDPNCRISISLFPNSLSFDANNVSLKYVHSLANTPNKDVDIQAAVIANPSRLTTSGDYTIIELFADTTYDEVAAIKLGSTIYKLYNYTPNNLNKGDASKSIARMNNGYCTKGGYNAKTFFNIAVPSTWGDTKEAIANYIQTNNIAVVINPSEYLNSADTTGSTTINKYQLKPTVEPGNTTDPVVWSVSPEGIVTADNGLVKAVSNGETVVTATCGSHSATCNVTVSGVIQTNHRVFKIDSTCMNTTNNKLTDSIGGIEATLGGAPTVSNNQIVLTENDNFVFDISSLNLTSKNRTFRIKFTPTSLDRTTKCVLGIGSTASNWSELTSAYITDTKVVIQHGSGTITNYTVGYSNSSSTDNRLPNREAPSLNTEYELVITEEADTNKIRWFINGTLVQDGTTELFNPLFLANVEGTYRFVGSYSLIEIYEGFCNTYDDFTNLVEY